MANSYDQQELVQANIAQVANAVRAVGETVLRLPDEQMLAAVAKLGQMASAVSALQEGFSFADQLRLGDGVVATDVVVDLTPQVPLSSQPEGDSALPSDTADTGFSLESSDETVLGFPTAARQYGSAESLNKVEADDNLFSDREKILLDYLERHAGQKVSPADLRNSLGEDMSKAASQQAVSHFLRKLTIIPQYSERLRFDGRTTTRRWWLVPEQVNSESAPEPGAAAEFAESTLGDKQPADTPVAPSRVLNEPVAASEEPTPPKVTPLAMSASKPPERPAESGNHPKETSLLTSWGLTISQNGYKQALVNGQRLPLRARAIDAAELIAGYPNGITFSELRKAMTLKAGSVVEPSVLDAALKELGYRFADFGDVFSDRVEINERGGRDRIVKLHDLIPRPKESQEDGGTQEASPDFLVRP